MLKSSGGESRVTQVWLLLNWFRMTGTTLLEAVYGYEVTSAHDPLVELVESALDHMGEAGIPSSKFVHSGRFVLGHRHFLVQTFMST
jgi:hypothetical protein